MPQNEPYDSKITLTIRNLTNEAITVEIARKTRITAQEELGLNRHSSRISLTRTSSRTSPIEDDAIYRRLCSCEPLSCAQYSMPSKVFFNPVKQQSTANDQSARIDLDVSILQHVGEHDTRNLRTATYFSHSAEVDSSISNVISVCVFESLTPKTGSTWMSKIPAHTPLSLLSIPGTHNSATCYRALPSVRCQQYSVTEQLEHGIRFFDVRVQLPWWAPTSNHNLNIVHGAFPIAFTPCKSFATFLSRLSTFLKQSPSETVILSLKREGANPSKDNTDATLSSILWNHYITQDPELWYISPEIPTLGEARGKIVLLRRFSLAPELAAINHDNGYGLDAECWRFNTTDHTHGAVRVQDYCDILEAGQIPTKVTHTLEHLRRAEQMSQHFGCCDDRLGGHNNSRVPPLYLNFGTGSNFFRRSCWPERIAETVNPQLLRYLCTQHGLSLAGRASPSGRSGRNSTNINSCTGIVVLDWVGAGGDWDLVDCIVAMNTWLLREAQDAGLQGQMLGNSTTSDPRHS